ncbi:hypothetical protein WMF04_33315 [Sorangium sp. So ce260]
MNLSVSKLQSMEIAKAVSQRARIIIMDEPTGGIGTVGGILTGVLIFEVLNNGLVVLGGSAYWQQIIKGIIIVAAVSVDIRKYLRKR